MVASADCPSGARRAPTARQAPAVPTARRAPAERRSPHSHFYRGGRGVADPTCGCNEQKQKKHQYRQPQCGGIHNVGEGAGRGWGSVYRHHLSFLASGTGADRNRNQSLCRFLASGTMGIRLSLNVRTNCCTVSVRLLDRSPRRPNNYLKAVNKVQHQVVRAQHQRETHI